MIFVVIRMPRLEILGFLHLIYFLTEFFILLFEVVNYVGETVPLKLNFAALLLDELC